jgi:hypothetical protein
MRIQNDDTDELLRAIWLYLTASEAQWLAEALQGRLNELAEEPDPERHSHVESEDGNQQVSVVIFEPGDPRLPQASN